jgi:hypothetical protein
MQDEVRGQKGAWGVEEGSVVDEEEWREVMAESVDQRCGEAGRVPSGEPLGVDGGEAVDLVAVPVWDALGGVSNRADEGDEECRESCVGGVTKTEAPFRHWEEGKVSGKGREGALGTGEAKEESFGGGLDGIHEG